MALGSGGPEQFGQRSGKSEAEIQRLVRGALDLGINLFDTSPGYGESELILGRALQGVPRDRFLVSTKVVVDDAAYGDVAAPPEQVVSTIDASLQRLQLDTIHVLFLAGWPKPVSYDRIVADTIPVLRRLQEQGKFRFLSASEKSAYDGEHEYLARGLRDDLFDSVVVAYNMINQSAEREVLPLCQANNAGSHAIFAVRRLFTDNARIQETLAELKRKAVVGSEEIADDDPFGWLPDDAPPTLVSAAYKFCLSNPAVSTVITGPSHLAQLTENVAAATGSPLPEEHMQRLRHIFGGVTEVIGN